MASLSKSKKKERYSIKEKAQAGLQALLARFNFFIVVKDLYHRLLLKYSELLVARNPDDWTGYSRVAQYLVKLKRFHKAQAQVGEGLRRNPNQPNLLAIAADISRASGDRSQALKYAELLIRHHPSNWSGYALAAQDRLSLGAVDVDREVRGLERFLPLEPNSKWSVFLSSIKANDNNPSSRPGRWIRSYSLSRSKCNLPVATVNHNEWQPFQYWSQGEPPAEVRKVTETWNYLFRSLEVPPVQLFDKKMARDYIEEFCPGLLIPFVTAFHYAVEADIFRVAFAQKNNCIWLDSDLYPKVHTKDLLSALLAEPKTTLLFRWYKPWVTNAFFMTPSSSAFFANILNQTQGIDFRSLPITRETIFNTFGPGRYNANLDDLGVFNAKDGDDAVGRKAGSNALRGYAFINEHNFASMDPPFRLSYRATSDSWQHFIRQKESRTA